jgi:hypothetical protein
MRRRGASRRGPACAPHRLGGRRGGSLIQFCQTLPFCRNNGRGNSDLRHLRNCFSHGNWWYEEGAVTKESMVITLEDYRGKDHTWAASIDMVDFISLAQKRLVITFKRRP